LADSSRCFTWHSDSLQYFPERRRTAPSAVDLPEAEEVVLDTADGEHIIIWHVAPRDGQPIFLYFLATAVHCAGGTSDFVRSSPTAAALWR
jgi:hypothetical protein